MSFDVKKTWDDERLVRDRLALIQARMREQAIGALLLNDQVYARYALNIKVPAGSVFVPAEGEAIAFIRSRDQGYVKLHHINVRPPIYDGNLIRDGSDSEEANRFGCSVAALMAEHGVSGAPLGVGHLGPSAFQALERAGLHLVESAPVVERTWSVKTADEMAIYRVIGEQYAHTIRRFREALRPGVTEKELATVVESAWNEAGGEDIAQLNVCAGEDMNPWRRWPSQRAVKDGEFVGIDLHGRGIGGLRGDTSRTFFVGDDPSSTQRDLYRQAYHYLLAAADEFRAGRTFQEVVDVITPRVPEKYRKQQFNLNVGHGAALGFSGYPHLDPRQAKQADDVLRVNQLIAVECFFGEVGSPLAVKLEEMIFVTDDKPERLAAIPFEDRLLAD